MKNQKGFSLIELLIVVVIIGIIAAIAIPNLIAARRAANEGSAVSTTRTIHSAQVTYQATNGGGEFAFTLGALTQAKLVDSELQNGKSGYTFLTGSVPSIKNVRPATFAVLTNATVGTTGATQSGTRGFCIATDGVLYHKKSAADGTAGTTTQAFLPDGSVICANMTAADIVE